MTNKPKRYCALGFGNNFFYALGKDALPIPNHLLLQKISSDNNEEVGVSKEEHHRERRVGGDNEQQQQKQQQQQEHSTTTCVSLMPIHPNVNATTTTSSCVGGVNGSTSTTTTSTATATNTSYAEDENDDNDYNTADEWLRHQLGAQSPSSTSSSSSQSHNRKLYISDNIPVLSCGATHTSMIVPSGSSSTTPTPTTIAGDAHMVGTIFGHAHHHLTIQPSRLPLRIVRISSGRRHVLALTEGSTPSTLASSSSSSFNSFNSSSSSIASSSSPSFGAGVVVSWGAGHFGQLGHGTDITSCLGPRIINRLLPHVVGGNVVEIAAGGLHSAAIVVPHYSTTTMNNNNHCRRVVMYSSRNNGSGSSNRDNTCNDGEEVVNEIVVRETRTFVWGSNRKGQCGIDGGKCATVPEPLPVVSVRRGGGSGDATVSSGGDCSDGSSGGGNTAPTDHPVDRYVHFEKLSLGRLHTVALTAYGEVFAWGSTSMGRCGQGSGPTTTNSSGINNSSSDRRFVQRPRHVSALRDVVIESIAAGGAHTLALSRGGRVYAWGAGGDGQCGQGHAGNLFSPRVVWGLPPWSEGNNPHHDKHDACIPHVNSKVAMAVTLEEEALSKALSMSQISANNSSFPSSSESESDRVVSIRASGCYSAAITARGEIYTWGYGSGSAIGHPIPLENDLPYIPIIEGNQYSVSTAAKVFPEGGSEDNIIRDCRCFDTDLNVMLPRRVECIKTLGLRVKDASLGPGHMVVLCSLNGDSDDDEKHMDSDLLLLDNNDVIADTQSINNTKGKGKQQSGTSVSAHGLHLVGEARPSLVTSNTTSNIADSVTTIDSTETSVSDNRRRSSGWISKIKPSSRASKSNLPTSSQTSPETEKKKSFMQKLRRGNNATAGGGGGAK